MRQLNSKELFKTRCKQLDLIQIEVDSTTFLFLQYQSSFYSNDSEPEFSTRFYNEYELDKAIHDIEKQYELGIINEYQAKKSVTFIAYAKELLHNEFADIIEFVENITGDD